MRTTLLVENNSQLCDFYALNLHTWVGSDSIMAKEAKFAVEYLQEKADEIGLIICKAKIGQERTAEAIENFLDTTDTKIPLIIIGDSPLKDKSVPHLDSAIDIKALVQAGAKALGVTAQDMAQLSVPEYFGIPIQNFHHISEPICDVFREEDNKYEVHIAQGQTVSKPDLKSYIAEGNLTLFVKRADRLKFVSNISQEIAANINLTELNEDEKVGALELSQQLLQQKLAKIGVTPELVELSKRNMKEMAAIAKKTTSLKRLLQRLLKNKAGYLFKHSQVLMFVATHLMEQLDWGNEEQRVKLQFMAFFHDIALEDDQQAMIHSEAELKKADLPPLKKELVKKHAQLGATLIAQYPNAPIGVEQLMRQHHGITHGIGFSEHYGANISPMAIVFILAEDFVDEVLMTNNEFDIKKKIKQMRTRYSTQRFQKIIDALEGIVV